LRTLASVALVHMLLAFVTIIMCAAQQS